MRADAIPHLIRAAGDDAVRAYRGYFDSRGRSRNTRRLYASHSRRFFEWAGRRGLTLTTIDAAALAAYAREVAATKSRMEASIYLTPVRGVFRALADAGALAENPCAVKIPIPLPQEPAAGTQPPMPRTPEEWQAAVDAADMALAVDSLMQYGLIEATDGDFAVNGDRCNEILDRGRSLGYTPSRASPG